MARFTGSRPWRGLLWPAAATRPAASRISPASLVPVAGASAAVISRPPSARYPGQPEPEGRDELPLDLVDPAAEGQHEVAFRLNVQPNPQLGGRFVGRVAVPADDLRKELAEALQPLRSENLGRGRVGDVHRLRRRDLPVQQLVDAQAGLGLAQCPPHVGAVEQWPSIRCRLAGGPAAYPVIHGAEPAGRA